MTIIYKNLLQADIVIVKGLTNLESLREERVFFIVLPLKIEEGDGTLERAIAIEDYMDEILP